MTNLKTLKKILEYLKTQNKEVTFTEIFLKVKVNYKSLKNALLFLKEYNLINYYTNGRTILVSIKNKLQGD